MYFVLDAYTKSEIIRKTNSLNERFNAFVEKYIGDGVGAMIIALVFIVLAIIVVKHFAKK